MRTHGVDDGFKSGILEFLRGGSRGETELDASFAGRVDQVLRCAAHLLLARRDAGDVQLTAQRGGLLEQGHIVSTKSRDPGCFQTGRATAEDCDLPFLFRRGDAARRLTAVFGVENAGDELAVLDGVGAALVAADAAADITALAGGDLLAPVGVCQQRTAQSHDVRLAALDDTLGHLGIHDTADGTDRNIHSLFDVACDVHKEAIRLDAHRRNGIGHVAGVVCLCNVEHIHAVLDQPLRELHCVGLVDAALAALGRHDGQLIINNHIRNRLADGTHQHPGKPGAVLETAAELVGAVVHPGRAETAGQTVAMNLNHIDAGLLRTDGAGAHLVDDGQQHLLAGLIGEEHHIVMQTLAHLVELLLHKQAVDGVNIVLRVENLNAQLGAVSVDAVGQCLERRDLAVVEQLGRRREAVDGCDIAQNDIAHTALCQTGVEAHILLADHAVLFVTGRQRRKHDAVFKGLSAHLDGLQNLTLHV